MTNLDNLIAFFGWCTMINAVILLFITIVMLSFGPLISKIQSKMFNLRTEALNTIYMQYLANYKLAILVLNLVPYIALKVINA